MLLCFALCLLWFEWKAIVVCFVRGFTFGWFANRDGFVICVDYLFLGGLLLLRFAFALAVCLALIFWLCSCLLI